MGVYDKLERPVPNWVSLVEAGETSAFEIATDWLNSSNSETWMSDTGRHCQDVIVERARVAKRARAAGIELCHQAVRTAERAAAQSAADVLSERRHIGGYTELFLKPARRQSRRHDLVED